MIDEGLYARKSPSNVGIKFFTCYGKRDKVIAVERTEEELRSDLKKITESPDAIINDLVLSAKRGMDTEYFLPRMVVWAELG